MVVETKQARVFDTLCLLNTPATSYGLLLLYASVPDLCPDANIADYGDNQWVTCFQESAEAILGQNSAYLGQLKESNEAAFDEIFQQANFHTHPGLDTSTRFKRLQKRLPTEEGGDIEDKVIIVRELNEHFARIDPCLQATIFHRDAFSALSVGLKH
ncbi:hypothetical protein CRUP_036204 [Coryphaenoides rupestris]|nr:hypothetical protein CRUP_036204 [Coryphaenoides rupestris]